MTILVIGHYFAGDIERQGQITLFPTSVTGVFSTFQLLYLHLPVTKTCFPLSMKLEINH